MTKPLLIWTNQHFEDPDAELLQQQVAPHRVVWAKSASKSVLAAGERDPAALEADILYGQPHLQDVLDSSRVRLVQLTTAGYTRYDNPAVFDSLRERGIAFCNASGLYDEPCAQHALAMLLSIARALPSAAVDQQHRRWRYLPLRAQSTLLGGQRTLIAGYGSIAKRLIELLAPLHLDVIAFRRRPRGDENVPTRPIAEFDQHLNEAQIVINILPLSEETNGFFDAARFAKFRTNTIYINIGRGDTNDQDALADALESGLVSAAFLDVTSPEPLPPEHRLWHLPNCHITPHTAGGTFDEPQRMIAHFVGNLRKYEKGEKLVNRLV
jgi:phosphoglycerate dehydrogenase-like enzyme